MSAAGLLLRGAFLEGEEALEAWSAWQATVRLDDVDAECFALLPLLHRNLEGLGAGDAELGRLKGVRRRIWLENQLVQQEAAGLLRRLESTGIQPMLLGGLALVAGYYRDPGLRPIRQIELHVRPGDARRADQLLGPASSRVALRRRALFLGCPRRIQDAWWAAATPVGVLDAPALVLAPADQLIHTLVTGMWWSHIPAGWWMADALVILSDPRVTGERVLEIAAGLRVQLFVRHALEQLGQAMGRPVSPELLDGVSRLPVSSADRLEYQYVSQQRWRRPLLSWFVAPPRRFYRSHS